MQTFLIVIWFCILGISLGSKSDAIENAWSHNIQQKVGERSEPGRKKGGNVRVILSSPAGPWRLRYGSFGPHPG